MEHKPRAYNFTPEKITQEEQQIIGDCPDEVVDLIEKWFKLKADHNNDLLIHSHSATPEQVALYKTAILAFDDWRQFISHCRKTSESR